MSTTANDLFGIARLGAEKVGAGFERADADWEPVVFAALANDEGMIVPIPSYGDVGEIIAHTLRAIGSRSEIEALAFIVSTWIVKIDPEDPRKAELESGELAPSDCLDMRREMVMIAAADRDQKEIVQHAWIIREDSAPPKLSEWADMSAGEQGGRLMDALREAVQ